MKLSYTTLSVKDRSIEDAIKIAKQYGLDGIELRGMGNAHISCSSSFEYILYVKKLIDDNGLVCPCLTSYEKLNQTNKKQAIQESDSLLRTIELATVLNARSIRIFMGTVSDETQTDVLMENRQLIMERTKDSPVRILIETHDSARTGKILKSILEDAPNCYGVIWDIIHPWTMGEDYRETWDVIGDKVYHVHIKDVWQKLAEPYHDYSLIGKGVIPVESIVRMLLEKGYNDFFSLEWEPSSDGYRGVGFEEQLFSFCQFMRSIV